MKAKNHLTTLTAAATLALSVGSAQAVSLFFSPSSRDIEVAESTTVDLVVSGFGDMSSKSLGAWAVAFTYDDTVVSLDSITFGSELDVGVLGSFQSILSNSGGLVSLDEVSLESDADLNANQPGSFTLATFGFTGLVEGVSPLSLVSDSILPTLACECGEAVEFDTKDGVIRVGDKPPVGVPEAGHTLVLFGLALLGLLGFAKRRQSAVRTG